jgi:hypothetical protein
MTTNKGTCTEVVKDGEPFMAADKTKKIQGYMLAFSDGGRGMVWHPEADPLPWEVGKEYAYYATFTKNGIARIHHAPADAVTDRDTAYVRIEALKMADTLMQRDPQWAGKPVKDYAVTLKLAAKSMEAHINRKD